jgi:hypothetical protein
MRIRHLGPFPFRFYLPGAGANPAALEPLSLSLRGGVELWWRLQAIQFTVRINITYDGTTADLNDTFNAFRIQTDDSSHTEITSGQEHLLCYPGADNGSENQACTFYETHATAYSYWTDISAQSYQSISHFFTTPTITASAERRATWPVGGDIDVMQPACDLGVTVLINDSVMAPATVRISNIAPTGYSLTGSKAGTLFGTPITWEWGMNEGDYAGIVVNDIDCAVSKYAWFEYDTQAGGAPVWNLATGAQILDPREASVP